MTADVQSELEALGQQLTAQGYPYRAAKHFSDNGIIVFPAAQQGVLEAAVFLYERKGTWIARVTSQGGSHWIRTVKTCADLTGPALEALRSADRPPARGWLLD